MILPMAFLNLGPSETILILLVVVLLFGPKRIPELARSLGKAKKEFTKATHEVSEEIEKMKELPSDQDDSSKKS